MRPLLAVPFRDRPCVGVHVDGAWVRWVAVFPRWARSRQVITDAEAVGEDGVVGALARLRERSGLEAPAVVGHVDPAVVRSGVVPVADADPSAVIEGYAAEMLPAGADGAAFAVCARLAATTPAGEATPYVVAATRVEAVEAVEATFAAADLPLVAVAHGPAELWRAFAADPPSIPCLWDDGRRWWAVAGEGLPAEAVDNPTGGGAGAVLGADDPLGAGDVPGTHALAYALALRAADAPLDPLNFLAAKATAAGLRAGDRGELMRAVLAAGLVVLLPLLAVTTASLVVEHRADRVEVALAARRTDVIALTTARADLEKTRARVTAIRRVAGEPSRITETLATLATELPPSLWFADVTAYGAGSARVAGFAEEVADVADYVAVLEGVTERVRLIETRAMAADEAAMAAGVLAPVQAFSLEYGVPPEAP